MTGPITTEQIAKFAVAWFFALDIHAPIEECYLMLADEGLAMRFPDGDIHDQASFKTWYDRLINLFFDENHTVHSVDARISSETAEVEVVVGWQASWWQPPAPKSKRVSLDATPRWSVRRSTKNAYGLEIVRHDATAEPFKYAPSFARLSDPLERNHTTEWRT